MKKTGAELAVYALEQIGVRYTFGIPGVHNTEIYDELNKSSQIEPILVTHEGCASFMADAVSRTTDSIGTCVIVPAAGTTHAMSGIGEAFLDGIPMLVISGGTRKDSGKYYQLHQIDQETIVGGLVKKYFLIESHEAIIPTIYEAYKIANSGEPGPVFIEIPVELQLFQGNVNEFQQFQKSPEIPSVSSEKIAAAVSLLQEAAHPGIYVGWGALGAVDVLKQIAELLVAPVSTTFQGLSSFPANHPYHTGVGFGPSSVPAASNAFKGCDCLLAIGVRFSELATGSFGMEIPENLIHVDINPAVFDKNYKSKVAINGDALDVSTKLLEGFQASQWESVRDADELHHKIAIDKKTYIDEWNKSVNEERVSPGRFFASLRERLPGNCQMVVDDGKHTFLTAELFPVYEPGGFISPTDFNCMGYCVPASIATKMASPDRTVAAIVGDGAFMMTGLELITASTYGVGVMVFVFHDGELGQISQFQQIPLNIKTCTVIGDINIEGVALATGAHFISMENDSVIDKCIDEAVKISAEGRPVLVDVKIDYSKKTRLTKGVVKTNLSRFPIKEKIRFIGRAIKRHVVG